MADINKQREKTLLYGCLLSAWAPMATGYAAFLGQSVLLFADFLRRTSELVGLIVSWYIARRLNHHPNQEAAKILKLEYRASIVVGSVILLSGFLVGASTIKRFSNPSLTTNIGLGLFLAIAGGLVNGWFYLRYTRLAKLQPGPILQSQKNLYRAKTITDLAIALALVLSKTLPAPLNVYIDPIGSGGISLLLLITGYKTLVPSLKASKVS